MFIYEVLLTNDPDAIIKIALRRKPELRESMLSSAFSVLWIQLRVAGRGLKIMEDLIEDMFAKVGYRSEEWIGVQN